MRRRQYADYRESALGAVFAHNGVEYHDLGSRHFEQRDKEQLAKRLLQRLRDLGVAVEVKAA